MALRGVLIILTTIVALDAISGGFSGLPVLPLLGALGLCLCACMCVFVGVFPCSCCFSGLRGCLSCIRGPRLMVSDLPWPWPVRIPCFSHFCATLEFVLILWQISFNGIRVGEASNPGPSALNSSQASNKVTIPLPMSQVEDFAVSSDVPPCQLPSLSVVSGSGVSPAVAANPYVSASPPPQPLLARPSRFCSFSRPGSVVRRLSSQARSARPAPRRSRSPPQVSALALSGQSHGSPPPHSRSRLFCPVPSCSDSCPPSHGWATFGSMRPHIDAHLAGQLAGDISMDWLRGHGFGTCEVCQRVLSLRFNGRCPSCFRAFSSCHDGASGSSRPLAEGAPGVWEVFTSDRRVRTSVPKGARDAWSRCLISALADVVAHRDVKSWTDLLTLPALVLPAPSRGGRRHVLRHESAVRRRCLDWLSGIRADLWAPSSAHKGKGRSPPSPAEDDGVLPPSIVAQVSTLIQEGALRRACAALLQDPQVRPTEEVVASLRLLHPAPPDEDLVEMDALRRVSPGAAPTADVDQVGKALWSFPSTSGAGRSGLRPSHVRDAMRPADLLLRLLAEVVSREVPEAVRPYVCGASIMALRKPNGTLRPIAIGETIRRLASKVAVDLITERAREIFEPLQLEVRTPNGCEAIVHAAGQCFFRNGSDACKVAISVDV